MNENIVWLEDQPIMDNNFGVMVWTNLGPEFGRFEFREYSMDHSKG